MAKNVKGNVVQGGLERLRYSWTVGFGGGALFYQS